MFLSGDRHHTELIRRDEVGLYPLYDLTSSPLTSKSHEVVAELNNPARVPGTLVTQRNFATLVFEGRSNERAVMLTTYDVAGRQLWQRTIRAAELKFPRK
jgi:alkaline phosphatase D